MNVYTCAVRRDRWDLAERFVDHERVDVIGTSVDAAGDRSWTDGAGSLTVDDGDDLDDTIAVLREWSGRQPPVRRLMVQWERRRVLLATRGGSVEDTEEYVSLAMTWDPPGGLGAATRELVYRRIAREDVPSAVVELTATDLDAPGATSRSSRLPNGPLLFSPYATAQLLDRIVPHLFAPSVPGYQHGLPEWLDCTASLVDGVAYGGGRHRSVDDEGVGLAETAIVRAGFLARPLARCADGHPPTGHGFRDSHRVEIEIRPRALRLEAAGDEDPTEAHTVHSVQQLRTGGGHNDGQLRFVARVTVGRSRQLVLVPMRTTAHRLLAGVRSTSGVPRPFPLRTRVLGTASLFSVDAFTWDAE